MRCFRGEARARVWNMLNFMPENYGGILLLERLRPNPSLLKSAIMQSSLADRLIHLDSPAEALSSVMFANLDLILLSTDVQSEDCLDLLSDLLEQPLGAPVIFVTQPQEGKLALAGIDMGAIVCTMRTGWDAAQLVQFLSLRPRQRQQQALVMIDEELETIQNRTPDPDAIRSLFGEKTVTD